jgi:uncharacterized membrane protein YgcG
MLLTMLAVLGLMLWTPSLAQASSNAASGTTARSVAASQATEGERILSFVAAYDLASDGSVGVTETLVWQFGPGEHHGIKRNITVRQGVADSTGQFRVYEMSDVAVSSPSGANTEVQLSEVGNDNVIRIGSPDKTFSGAQQQTYVVRYRLAHVVNGFPDHAELYWNVTGGGFDIPLDSVKATVHGPAAVTDALCFKGADRSAAPCQASAERSAKYSSTGIGPSQQMTIVASFPASAFTDTTPDLRDGNRGASGDTGSQMSPSVAKTLGFLGYGGGLSIPVLAAALMGTLVWRRRRDEENAGLTSGPTPAAAAPGPITQLQDRPVTQPEDGPVTMQFAPPEGVRPGLVGTIIDEQASTIDVSATVIDLAARGYLTIEAVVADGAHRSPDWKLTRMVPTEPPGALLPYEQTVLAGIFAESNPVLLSSLKNKFHTTLTTVESQMYAEVTARGWFRKSPNQVRRRWTMLASFAAFAGFGAFVLMGDKGQEIDSAGGPSLAIPPGVALAIGLFVAAGIMYLLGQKMASRTAVGRAVLAQSLGFKEYLVSEEARQIRFEEAQDIFSHYLPYAIVFGVADRWAGTFSRVAESATLAGRSIGIPTWYIFSGSGGYRDYSGIASGMDSFSTSASGTFTSTPASSGSSGFSGGGFSGGGGGGGGGGSW